MLLGTLAAVTWVATYGSFILMDQDVFGSFYDAQARSLVQLHWDVPEEALGFEAFIHEGRYYGYFGPAPALPRAFLNWLWPKAYGQWTRLSLIAGAMISVLAACVLLCQVRLWMGAGPPGEGLLVLWIGVAGIGSTTIFLASRSYAYHEAIMWGTAFTIACSGATLAYLRNPSPRLLLTTAGFSVVAMQSRAPSGLACVAVSLVAAVLLWGRSRRRALAMALLAGALPLVSWGVVNWAKFGSPWNYLPLRWHVPYSSNPERLAKVHGSLTHVQNIPYNSYRYFLSVDVCPHGSFPFVWPCGPTGQPAPAWTRIDLIEYGITLVGMQPALLALAVAGVMAMWVTRSRGLCAMAVAALLPVGIMLMSSALSCRYKQDALCGLLFFGAASTAVHPRRWYLTACLLALGAYSVQMNLGSAWFYQGKAVWGAPNYAIENYNWLNTLLTW
jgi:hypothetical protein